MSIFVFILFILMATAVLGGLYLKHRLNNTADNGNLEATLDTEVRKLTHRHPSHGMVVGIYKDGKSFIKGYGFLSNDNKTPPGPRTIFQLASVSKLFTAATLQVLCDEGVARMDATLGEVIGGTLTLSPAAQQVTLEQLATHTSGFPKVPKTWIRKVTKLVGRKNLLKNPYSYLELKDVFDYLQTSDGKREPGRFKYSNFGMGLLGHVMEMMTKNNLDSVVSEKLLTSLGMHSTAIALTPEMERQLAPGHAASGELNPIWTFGALGGAGAFNSNASDMMKFIQANIDGSSPIIHSLKRTHKKRFDGHTGIGWLQPTFLDRFLGNRSIIWHNGLVGGYASYISVDTKNKTGLVLLSNKAIDVTMLGIMVTRQVRTQSWSPQQTF